MNKWNIKKDMTEKMKVTEELAVRFPSCCGRRLMLMTSFSFNDFSYLASLGKIDGDSFVYNVDNLAGNNDFISENMLEGEKKIEAFERLWKQKASSICKKNGISMPSYELMFGDILSMPLRMISPDDPFALVYADTCNIVSDKFFDWLFYDETYHGIADDGVLAFTLTLNHKKINNIQEKIKDYSDKFAFYGAEYDDYDNMQHYQDRMNHLAYKIESTGQWVMDAMFHYCEKDRKSQMVSVICKKAV